MLLRWSFSKPRTQRVKRALEERAPKLVENTKAALFLRGKTTSDVATRAMKDLVCFKSLALAQ